MAKKIPVLQFTKDGEFVAEHESTLEAAKAISSGAGNIYQCCSPYYYAKTVKGYIFKFKDSEQSLNQIVCRTYNVEILEGEI
jgi:hypothetical protein